MPLEAILDVVLIVLGLAGVVAVVLLGIVLWQASLAVAQVRTTLLPQVHRMLIEAQASLRNVEDITGDVDKKLEKLDEAVNAANTAVQAIGQTTVMVNRTVAQPLVINLAALIAGLKGGVKHLQERRTERPSGPPVLGPHGEVVRPAEKVR